MTLDFICFMLLTMLFLFFCGILWEMKEFLGFVILLLATVGAFSWAFYRAGIIH